MTLTKSKQALADAIHASGKGWPDGANWACQHKRVKRVVFTKSTTKPKFNAEVKGWGVEGDCFFKGFTNDKLLPNWHQTVLSCDEYFSAYPAELVANADGWIEWNGVAKSPVIKGVVVDVKMKNGTQHFGQLMDDECWGDHWGDASIIAYRLHKPGADVVDAELTTENAPKTTIEQLAADYRNKLNYANRRQQEADDAKAAADAALGELERAGEALGLVIGIAKTKPEPEWIEWSGGECPVTPDTACAYKMRGGELWKDGEPIKAHIVRWEHDGDESDIIAYRICK